MKLKQKSYTLKTICLMIPTHKKVSNGVIKEINFGVNIEISSDDEVAIGGPKKNENNSQPKYRTLSF